MYTNRSRGFTLIELLVVIAIIGILSAVVLASLNTARSKGNDAAVQSDLSTIQTQAEIFYGVGNTYGPQQTFSSGLATSCLNGMFGDTTITKALAGADLANGTGNVDCATSADGTTYVVAVATSAGYWCVDSTGNAKGYTSALPTIAISECPAS